VWAEHRVAPAEGVWAVARPGVVLGLIHHSGPYRIELDILVTGGRWLSSWTGLALNRPSHSVPLRP
jgi:hypothetical protein